MNLPFPLEELKQRASGKKKAFRRALDRSGSGSRADKTIHALHHEVFAETDCLSCANCCKTTGPLFTHKDVERISSSLKMKPSDFIAKYLRTDEDGDLVLQSLPCPFLDHGNYCTIYDDRPRACREYPHTHQTGQAAISMLTVKNASVCPAVYRILEKLEAVK